MKHKIVEKIETSFEIGYNYFSEVIWPTIRQDSCIHPSLVWTEIMSYIKGSVEALETPTGYLSKRDYLELGSKRSPLPQGNRSEVYQIFLRYEIEKNYKKGYDLQDMVYHVYRHLLHEGYRGTVVHSITVDEVQDFTQATLRVLFNVCNQPYGFFFTGDTCQTIARGVGFRVAELKTLFFHKKQANALLNIEIPTVQQLLVNYRSHSNLLKLSNSIIGILEQRFPNAIDKLKKDRGTKAGPMPVIMNTTSLDELFLLLFGEGKANSNIEFGANQVIIVRDPESKKKLPKILQGAMVLTVYESKGLEFDDVILFDFFNESPCDWSSIGGTLSTQRGDESDSNKERVAQTTLSSLSSHENASNFSALLCSELKHLYTAVTRAKTRLFIFDRNVAKRSPLFEFWKREQLVEELTTESGSLLKESIVQKTSKEAWKQQGLNMLRNHHYTQASKCFQYSGDEAYRKKAEALNVAVEASNIMRQSIMVPGVKWTKKQVQEAQSREQEAKAMFGQAGNEFLELRLPKYAARCFASAGDHEKAAKLFESRGAYDDAARCYYSAELWQRAAQCYVKLQKVQDAIECLEKGSLWQELLETLSSFRTLIPEVQFEEYIRKYIPLLVEHLAKPQNQAEDSWQAMSYIISIIAPEIESKLRANASDGNLCFDNSVLELLEQHGFFELCIRLIIENKKRMDIDVEFEQDFKLQEYVGIVCYLNNNKNRATVRRACSNLYSISPTLAVELLLRYGLWIDAAELLIETDNFIQAATIYQAFGSFEKARQLYNKAIEAKVSPQLAMRLNVNSSVQELWSHIKKANEDAATTTKNNTSSTEQDEEKEARKKRLEELLKQTLQYAEQLKDGALTKRLKTIARLYSREAQSKETFVDVQKQIVNCKDDLFTTLYLLNKLARMKRGPQVDVKLTKAVIEITSNVFDLVLKHLSDTLRNRNDQSAKDEKDDLNLFFELQDPPPFSLPRNSVGGGHPFFIVKRTNSLLKKKKKNDGGFDELSHFSADNRGRYFYLSLDDSYFMILDHITSLYNRMSSSYTSYLSRIPTSTKWERTASEEQTLILRRLEAVSYLHRYYSMIQEVKSVRRSPPKPKLPNSEEETEETIAKEKLDTAISSLVELIDTRFSPLPTFSNKDLECLVSYALSDWPPESEKEVLERFRLLQLANKPILFDELIRRLPSNLARSSTFTAYSSLVDMSFYQSHGDFYNSSVSMMQFLNNVSLDDIPTALSYNLVQQHLSLLTVIAQSLNPKKTFYLPKSYYDKHILPVVTKQNKAFKFVVTGLDNAMVEEMIKRLFDWLLFFLDSGSIVDVEKDIVITALLIAANFNIPNSRDSQCFTSIRKYLAISELDDYWLGLVANSRLKNGMDWEADEFYEWLEEIGDPAVEVASKTLGIQLEPVKTWDVNAAWDNYACHRVTRLAAAIKISNFVLNSKSTQQFLTKLRQPYHARLASRYLLKACCKDKPSPALVRAAMIVSTEDAKLVKASMKLSQTLNKNHRLIPSTHTRELERMLIDMKEKRKAIIKWIQKAANDQISVTTSKSKIEDEFEFIGGSSEVKVQEIEEALRDLVQTSNELSVNLSLIHI
eukprot:TRINITY_DN3978_c0_g1_i2.p1 TRINITY_DN3978_c0_g1~~TRINITY_DN3978_c0_g1_i2.p1  ORF type:complete len:1649 (-),score=507.99 TRINITY_DN3978_c0_g1_i2:45-4790(-)